MQRYLRGNSLQSHSLVRVRASRSAAKDQSQTVNSGRALLVLYQESRILTERSIIEYLQ